MISVCLSLTFTPMLCGKFLKAPEPLKNPFLKGLETGFHKLERGYARGLDRVMQHKGLMLFTFICTAVLAVAMYVTSPTGFFPTQDTGFLGGALQTAQNSSYAYTDQKSQEAVKIISADPDVEEAHYNIGNNPTNSNLNVTLRTREDGRRTSASDIIARLRPKLGRVVGANAALQANQDINVGGRFSRAQYQYTLSDADLDELNEWAPKMLQALEKLPQLKDVNTDQQSTSPSATLTIDRDAAGRFGIAPVDIDAAIYNQIGGASSTT